jgi:hypothetical protein
MIFPPAVLQSSPTSGSRGVCPPAEAERRGGRARNQSAYWSVKFLGPPDASGTLLRHPVTFDFSSRSNENSLAAKMRHRPGVRIVTAVVAVATGTVGTFVSPGKAPGAGDRQSSIIERKVSCETELGALQIGVFARNPAAGAAAANIHTGDPSGSTPNILLAVDTRYKHYVLGSSCQRVAKRIPLTHRGLTSAGLVHAGEYRSPTIYCRQPRMSSSISGSASTLQGNP